MTIDHVYDVNNPQSWLAGNALGYMENLYVYVEHVDRLHESTQK